MHQNERSLLVFYYNQLNRIIPYLKYRTYFLALVLISLILPHAFPQAPNYEQNLATLRQPGMMDQSVALNNTETQQGITVSGRVTDSEGNPLTGVTITEKGTNNGTIADLNGNFTLKVSSTESVIAFSFVGFVPEEIKVGDQREINLTLIEDLIGLSEVVVVGYGSVKKSDITGSLTSVSSEQIENMPVININQAIQGRAAGVDVVNSSYGLNTKPEVRIRGNRSIYANNDPLYVVDGIPISGDITDLNPGDIESMEILKDASATAIYGSRGANGVILITTKKGQSGKFSVNLESTYTIKNPLRFVDQLSGNDWMEIARDNYRGSGGYSTPYPNPLEDYDILNPQKSGPAMWNSVAMGYEWIDQSDPNPTNWVVATRPTTPEERARWGEVMDVVPDEVPIYNPDNVRTYDWFSKGRNKNALTQLYNFNVSGGTDKVAAYFSLGYVKEQGLGVGESFSRISPRLNLDLQALKWLKVGMTSTFSSELTDPGEGLLLGVTRMIPLSVPYDETTGEFLLNPTNDAQIANPIQDELLNTHENRVTRYLGTYYAEISLTDHFKYKLNVSQDYRQYRNGTFLDALSSVRYPSVNNASYIQGQEYHYSMDNLLFYNREFGKHSIGVTLLQSVETRRMERTYMYAENLPYPTQLWYQLNSTLDPSTITVDDYSSWAKVTDSEHTLYFSKWQLASFMGRINYGLMDKYLLTASLRYDGSSVFYKDNRWDYFPSFALAWKVSDESFMKNLNFLNQLKLRFGYGTVGQAGNVPYETEGTLQETQYVFGEDPAKGYAPLDIQTKNVGWEKTTNTNIGIDFGFFRNRLSGNIDLYRSNTHDLLLNKTIPAVTGYTSVRANVGKTRNDGIEITLNSFNIDRGNFRWETNFTFSKNKEQIIELANGAEDDITNGWFIGYPIKSYFTYVYDGIWQVGDSALMAHYNSTGNNGFEPGEIRVKDVDGNDTINDNDRTVVGHSVPKFSGGITNSFYYKGFELSFFLYFRVGYGIYSRDGHYFQMTSRYATPFKVHYYKPMGTAEENATAVHPAPANMRDRYESALWYREASFLKVRNITLSYNVPKALLSKVNIQSLMLSVQAFNPFLFTDYPYLDPEAHNDTDEKVAPNGISTKGWTFSIRLGL
jgi:TonB-linked SusC/RagA family outer membrane protein